MNCNHVKHMIDLASMNKEALSAEARQHIETCESCRDAMKTSLFVDESLRTLQLEETPHGMETRIAARIAAVAADRERSKKRWSGAANLVPWVTATLGAVGFLVLSLLGIAGEAVQGTSTAPAGVLESSLILGDIWQKILAPQTLLSGLSIEFMVLGLFALCSIAAMGQLLRQPSH